MVLAGIAGASKLMGVAQGLGGAPSVSGAVGSEVGLKSTFGSTGKLKFAGKNDNNIIYIVGAFMLTALVIFGRK